MMPPIAADRQGVSLSASRQTPAPLFCHGYIVRGKLPPPFSSPPLRYFFRPLRPLRGNLGRWLPQTPAKRTSSEPSGSEMGGYAQCPQLSHVPCLSVIPAVSSASHSITCPLCRAPGVYPRSTSVWASIWGRCPSGGSGRWRLSGGVWGMLGRRLYGGRFGKQRLYGGGLGGGVSPGSHTHQPKPNKAGSRSI